MSFQVSLPSDPNIYKFQSSRMRNSCHCWSTWTNTNINHQVRDAIYIYGLGSEAHNFDTRFWGAHSVLYFNDPIVYLFSYLNQMVENLWLKLCLKCSAMDPSPYVCACVYVLWMEFILMKVWYQSSVLNHSEYAQIVCFLLYMIC